MFYTIALLMVFLNSFIYLTYASCLNGWVQGPQGICYTNSTAKQSWYDQNANCFDDNIASVPNAFINQYLISLAQNFLITEPFWLGGAVDYRGAWSWSDYTNFSYTNWAPNEPKNSSRGSCILMDPITGQWSTDNCLYSHPSICEDQQNNTYTSCLFDTIWHVPYSNIMNTCYFINIFGTTSIWNEWEQECVEYCNSQNMNCHSISIHNEFDNLFVQAFAQQSSPFFIGIYDAYENGTYKWYDGTPVDYSMWADTPPTGSCAMMKADSLFWYPVPCNSTAYWNIDSAVICHFPPN